MNTSEILNKAADLIETKGWTQNAFARRRDGSRVSMSAIVYGLPADAVSFCTVGALCAVSRRDPEYLRDEIRAIRDATDAEYVSVWNDAPGRTKEEVVAALRAAAKEAEACGS